MICCFKGIPQMSMQDQQLLHSIGQNLIGNSEKIKALIKYSKPFITEIMVNKIKDDNIRNLKYPVVKQLFFSRKIDK